MQSTPEAVTSLWRPFRETDGATVIHVDLTLDDARETAALDWLDDAERARRDRFLFPRPRCQFTLCRAVLRSLLCRELGCTNGDLSFGASNYGKPFARIGGTSSPAAFNVSHSGRHGLVAFALRGRIGVDVEERSTKRNLDRYIRLLFAPEERAELEKSRGRGRVDLFYRLWTLKEAAIKAVGAGLSIDPASFEIPPGMVRGERTGVFSFPETPEVRWCLENIDDTRFAAAIAYEPVEEPTGNPPIPRQPTGERGRGRR